MSRESMNKAVAGLLLCVCLVIFAPAALAAESGWVYQATKLLARFESIGVAKMTPLARQGAYRQLLNEVSQLAQDRDLRSRDARGNATFAAWLSRRIYEQLGDTVAAERMKTKYQGLRDSLPADEAAVFKLLFERMEAPQQVPVQRLCKVEAKGDLLKVRVVDYPIRSTMEKAAQAVGATVHVPTNVIGLADFTSDDWQPLRAALLGLGAPRGLWIRKKDDKRYSVIVRDRMYMASIGEIADKRAKLLANVTGDAGIDRGYVILHGHYIKPPYQINVQTRDKRYVVLLNGAVVFQSARWKKKPILVIKAPRGGQFSIKEKGKLTRYAGQQYAAIRRANGKEEAIHALEEFLKKQKIVKSFKVTDDGENLSMSFRDEPEADYEVLLHTFTRELDAKKTITPQKKSTEKEKRARAAAQRWRERIEATLKQGGLVIVPSNLKPKLFKEKQVQTALETLSTALQQIVRQRDVVHESFFGHFVPEKTDWAWELILNLRFRELVERWQRESAQRRAN